MAADLQALAGLLEKSLDPKQHKQAEADIRQYESAKGFSLALLQAIGTESFPQTTRLSAALYFKNFVRRSWVDEEGTYKLPIDEITYIKNELVGLMISSPSNIRAQLGDAISVIADSDFWERWDTLVADLVQRLTVDKPLVTDGALQVAHSIFRRWRPLFRSDGLYTEINHVVSTFALPFMNLISQTDAAIDQNASNEQALRQHMAVMSTSIKILQDLSCQDLPEVMIENLTDLINLLRKYLSYDNPLLHDEDEAGPIEFVKAGIFGLLTFWAQKYEEDIRGSIAGLLETSWNLLTSLGPETKNDLLVSRALNFLTSVINFPTHAENFKNEETLNQVLERAVLPNIALRETDVELFEDEPIEYIRRDLEGSDSETRRRAATDFLRQLMQQFQELVTRLTLQYVQRFMQDYVAAPSQKWQSKDTAIYLFCSIAAVGTVTGAEGVKSTNPHVNIIEFFSNYVAQDLVDAPSHVILQVDAVKYLYMFRSQLTAEQWAQAFPMLSKHLASPNYVVHTYCAIAVERILALTDKEKKSVIAREQVLGQAEATLRQLFKLITSDAAAEKIQENEFLMRCIMRILIVIREDALSFLDLLLSSFTSILNLIRHNPSNPRFYYYLFESIGALVRFCSPKTPQKMESTLFTPFATILQEQVAEFMPFVFQLFAALLEANPSEGLADSYTSLISPILTVSLWEQRGNAPALTRLLSALVQRGAHIIVRENQIEPVLGIFQNLIASKVTEVYAFELLESIVEFIPNEVLSRYYGQIFSLILTRLMSSKTEQLTLRFVRLYHFMASRDPSTGLGVDNVIALLEQVQQGIFAQLYTSVVLPETQKLSRPYDRKLAVIALTKTLTDSQAFAEKYAKGWGYTCEALLKLLLNPPVPPSKDELITEQDVDDASFGVGFTQLSTCRRAPVDPFPDIVDVKAWVGKYLTEAAAKKPTINTFVQERLSPEVKETLVNYMQG